MKESFRMEQPRRAFGFNRTTLARPFRLANRFLAALAFCLFTVGSAQAHAVVVPIFVPGTPPTLLTMTGNYDRIHNVAIVSGIGTTLTLRNNHILLPATWQADITDWKIDDEVIATLRQYLSSRYTVEDVSYDRAALGRISNGVWDNSAPALRKFLGTLPAGNLDAFIVVRPDLELNMPGIAGLALEHGNGIGDPPPVIWANYEIDVIDARTLATIARVYSRVQPRAGTGPSMAAFTGGQELAVSDNQVPSGKQRAELQGGFSRLVSMSIPETLRAMNLGIALPSVGARSVVPMAPAAEPFASIKSVAVISVVGDQLEFERQSGAVMSLSHSENHLPIADWQLDQEIEGWARAAMAKRFTIKDVPVDRAALAQSRLVGPDHVLKPDFPGLSSSPDVDAFVIFVKHPIELSLMDCTGVGIWNRSALFGAYTAVYANYAVALVDAHTLKLLAAHVGTMSPKSATPVPYRSVDNAMWPAAPPALSPSTAQQIHEIANTLLADSVPETLFRMGLTGMTVADVPPANTSAPIQ